MQAARHAGASTNPDRYKWIALSNTTLAILLATLDASITLIAMPDIFRGIHLDPLVPGNSFYLLWMILGYLVVSSVLIVSLGRLGDIFGRVRIYNLGFVIYTVASLLLAVDWLTGSPGALYLVIFRIVQGVGGACLLANAAAIITDAFPANQRGMALGINNIVGVSGLFVGLILGGLLAPIDWRLVFLISVPVGLFGTVWAYLKLEERSEPRPAKIDWGGNVTFALGLVLAMVAVTYGIRPYGGSPTGWGSPRVLALLAASVVSLIAFWMIERRVEEPMFRLPLFRIRAFTFGTLSTFLAAVARGGLMFMLIIWLQGIWLPLHGYDYTEAPLWAGIYMLPLTIGLLIAGPTSGYLSDRYGARFFATGGMLAAAVSFGLLMLLPVDFSFPAFAAILFMNGISMGMFASPNRAAVMNSLPKGDRGAGGGMNQTFQNSAQVISIGIFDPAQLAPARARSARGRRRRRPPRRPDAADLDPLRRLPWLQPDRTPGWFRGARIGRPACPSAARRPQLLPTPDLRRLQQRSRHRLHLRDRRLPGRRRRLAAARRPLPPRRRAGRDRGRRARPRASAPAITRTGGTPCELSGTASRLSPWRARRGLSSSTPSVT
jgi:MFS family permease